MTTPELHGYVPIRVYGQRHPFGVDWCHIGAERFREPFFDLTVQRLLQVPFNQLFRPQTTLEELRTQQAGSSGAGPAGFIFHMSRCGSTLVSRMLASVPQHIVISEAGPVDAVLSTHLRDPSVDELQRIAWLRALIEAYCQPREGGEARLFVKFDATHALFLPVIQRAFPAVPWLFLYRDPVEVLVSQAWARGGLVMPGSLPPELFGITREQLPGLSWDEYSARAIAAICEAALFHRNLRGRFVAYDRLPEAGWTLIAEHFGLRLAAEEIASMREAAQCNAKAPASRFSADGAAKRQAATPALRQLAARWLAPLHERLAAAERQQEKTIG